MSTCISLAIRPTIPVLAKLSAYHFFTTLCSSYWVDLVKRSRASMYRTTKMVSHWATPCIKKHFYESHGILCIPEFLPDLTEFNCKLSEKFCTKLPWRARYHRHDWLTRSLHHTSQICFSEIPLSGDKNCLYERGPHVPRTCNKPLLKCTTLPGL